MGMKQLWEGNGTIWFLEQFGLWANQPPDIKLGYPKMSNFAQMQGRMVALPDIDDDTAGFIHDCLNDLEKTALECDSKDRASRYRAMKSMIEEFYIKRRNIEKAGKYAGGFGRTKATEVLRCAEAWMDCKLNDYFKMTEAQRLVYTLRVKEAS